MDITDHEEVYSTLVSPKKYTYPDRPQHEDLIKPLLANLTIANLKDNLQKFTSFYTRYYRSSYGAESSKWLLSKVEDAAAINPSVSVSPFIHKWGQNSIIAHIPVSSTKDNSATRVVIGIVSSATIPIYNLP